ncbi:MAG: GNAT family N-acetyltransferase [Paracoccaceae bacterium]
MFYHAVRSGAADFYSQAQRAAWAPSDAPDQLQPDKLLDQWCWVAEMENGITGFMSLTPRGYLDMAFVMPEAKGSGVADALYAALITQATASGLGTLTVHASHLARRFLAKHGWQEDYAENHTLNGQVIERFHMSLDLTEVPNDRPL